MCVPLHCYVHSDTHLRGGLVCNPLDRRVLAFVVHPLKVRGCTAFVLALLSPEADPSLLANCCHRSRRRTNQFLATLSTSAVKIWKRPMELKVTAYTSSSRRIHTSRKKSWYA